LRKTSKTCPICRSHSHFIVPSSFFPDCGTTNGVRDKENAAKKEIVERYLARLKTLPCRYFEESIKNSAPGFMPKCKFGNRCHYLHSHPVTKQPYVFSAKELERPRKFNGNRRGVLDQIAMIGIILDELSLDFEYDSEDGSDAGYSSNSPVGYIDDNGYFYF
jgi:E3 ubiquitin-protein ligase makorin